jgi:hypothetical protein
MCTHRRSKGRKNIHRCRSNKAGQYGGTGVRLQAWFDVFGFRTRTDDAQTNGLVVLELEFKDGFDDGLAHGKAVLSFAFLNDTEAGCRIVRGKEAVEC